MANRPAAANNKKSAKPRGKPWPKGVSGNPAGRPPDGESWAGVLRWASELTGEQAASISPPELAREFQKLKTLKLKEAVTLRTFAAMLFDPSAGLFNAMMDRAEGKVADKIELNDLREKPDSDLIREFESIVDTARTRAGDGDSD